MKKFVISSRKIRLSFSLPTNIEFIRPLARMIRIAFLYNKWIVVNSVTLRF